MTPTAQLLLGMIGVATPFVLAGAAAWRSLNRSFQDMREDVAARSARQDTTLDDHERRLNRIEDIVF